MTFVPRPRLGKAMQAKILRTHTPNRSLANPCGKTKLRFSLSLEG